jgi:hypothetical protein
MSYGPCMPRPKVRFHWNAVRVNAAADSIAQRLLQQTEEERKAAEVAAAIRATEKSCEDWSEGWRRQKEERDKPRREREEKLLKAQAEEDQLAGKEHREPNCVSCQNCADYNEGFHIWADTDGTGQMRPVKQPCLRFKPWQV